MLLFIKEPDSTPDKNPGFQNIVCYCLSLCDLRLWNECFISKHRMLLFIFMRYSLRNCLHHFKTSYVTVYRSFCGLWWDILINFKTSYVTVYPMLLQHIINCSTHFKTSYVTVYPFRLYQKKKIQAFQNIVCYCLSVSSSTRLIASFISKHRMLLFIWICAK